MPTEFEKLDRLVLRFIRCTYALPPGISSAYLSWELRLPPSRLGAAFRAILEAAHIWKHTWIGERLLQPYWSGIRPGDRPGIPRPPGQIKLFQHGPLAYWNSMLSTYLAHSDAPAAGLACLHSLPLYWTQRKNFRATVHQALDAAFRQHIADYLVGSNLSPNQREAVMYHVEAELAHPHYPPLYSYEADDLPRAGLLFRAPSLSHCGRSQVSPQRFPCQWCGADDAEWGKHLLTCSRAPALVTRQRDAALHALIADMRAGPPSTGGPPPPAANEAHDSPANLARLYDLAWRGTDPKQRKRKPHRPDAGSQASSDVLRMALWYMRTCINEYSRCCPTFPPTRKPRVLPLPVYGRDPFLPVDHQ